MTLELVEKERNTAVSAVGDDVRRYLGEIRRYPRLTPDEERALAKRCAEGDEEAIRRMVNSNLRLVVSIAREYDGRGIPLLDLIQEGSIGLIAAAKKFDYTLDFRFSTYATKWIRQGITRCLENHTGLIRVPAHTAEQIRRVETARKKLLQKLGAEPTVEQLSAESRLSVEKVRRLQQLSPDICSLDAPTGEKGDGTLGILIEDHQALQPYEELVRQELSQAMEQLLGGLSERQQRLLRLRFGMEDGKCHSLEETGMMLGISKERARQIEKQSMERLHKMGSAMGLEDFLNE